jgi:hypothetical protein
MMEGVDVCFAQGREARMVGGASIPTWGGGTGGSGTELGQERERACMALPQGQ